VNDNPITATARLRVGEEKRGKERRGNLHGRGWVSG
jgi:hypothetical protein